MLKIENINYVKAKQLVEQLDSYARIDTIALSEVKNNRGSISMIEAKLTACTQRVRFRLNGHPATRREVMHDLLNPHVSLFDFYRK